MEEPLIETITTASFTFFQNIKTSAKFLYTFDEEVNASVGCLKIQEKDHNTLRSKRDSHRTGWNYGLNRNKIHIYWSKPTKYTLMKNKKQTKITFLVFLHHCYKKTY